MRAVTARGAWVWGLSGLATAAVLTLPAVRLLSHPGLGSDSPAVPHAARTQTFMVTGPVKSLSVQSSDDPVSVHAGSGPYVRVAEVINYDRRSGLPALEDSLAGGHLTLGDPVCATSDCDVSYDIAVPSTVFATVSSDGESVSVSGTAGAVVDSGGGPVTLASIHGPLTASSDGGEMQLTGVTGTLHADTGGGPLTATGIDGTSVMTTGGGELDVSGLTGPLQADSGGGPADLRDVSTQTAIITTDGGEGEVQFATAPQSVTLNTDGGPAELDVPGGPYVLNADSDGGPYSVSIATSSSASRTLAVISGGGSLTVRPEPGAGTTSSRVHLPRAPKPPPAPRAPKPAQP